MRLATPALLLLAMAGCSDYNLEGQKPPPAGDPMIVVAPEVLSFNDVNMGESAAQNFTITNIGESALEVDDLHIATGGSPFSVTLLDSSLSFPFLLQQDESTDAVVTYTRSGDGQTDQALVDSNDPSMPTATVQLNGGDTMPSFILDPDSWDAGAAPVGVETTGSIDIVSTGTSPVTISTIAVTGRGFGGTYSETLPWVLNPGDRMTVDLTFTAPDIATYTGELTVTAADAGVPVAVAPLNGEGAGGPIAICYANPDTVAANAESTTWYGADSYDTGGRTITTYEWTLVSKPGGSSATMPSGSANRRFTPDLAGEYVAELVVVNDLGQRSEPCDAILESTPSQDVWVEMYWTHNNDDMDLHLLSPGGHLRTSTDCYYANTNPDWGTRGDPADDPSLDLDDIPGTGPENINISTPSNGLYTVYVNDYTGSTPDYTGGNATTVNIYIGGALAYTDTKTITGEGSDTMFATIDWPSGTITA